MKGRVLATLAIAAFAVGGTNAAAAPGAGKWQRNRLLMAKNMA